MVPFGGQGLERAPRHGIEREPDRLGWWAPLSGAYAISCLPADTKRRHVRGA